MAKKKSKDEINTEDVELDENGEPIGQEKGSKVMGFLVAIIIIAIWLAIFAILIKMDVGGIGSMLRPYLKNVPGISMILPDATDEEVMKAADAAYVDHFIRTLEHGYDTMINEESSNISQGQKQLLTIARAFLADPKILILDEATSSVDTRTEVLIQKGMEKLMENRTSFVIAHRLSTIRDADLILVMKDGDIVEAGNHEDLMKENGFYTQLYNSQFEEE